MLKIFRKFRQRLLTESKYSKYVVYAIGEIFLVVIGILIALQVNNWNENRKTVLFENDMLKNLKVGMALDLLDIEGNISTHTTSSESQRSIINWLNSDLPYSDTLCIDFASSNMFTVFVSDRSSFETFKTKGLNLISRDSLRDKILYLYEFNYEIYNKRELVYNTLITKMVNDVNSKYFSNAFIDLESPESIIGCMNPNDPNELRSSTEYQYYITTLKEFNLFLINTMEDTRNNLKELIEMIDIELENVN